MLVSVAKATRRGIVCFALLAFVGCGSSGPAAPTAQTQAAPPTQHTYSFEVYNSVQGRISGAAFTRDALGGSDIRIAFSDIRNPGQVDTEHMVLRERNEAGRIGPWVALSTDGGISFKAPNQDRQYDMFLFQLFDRTDRPSWFHAATPTYDCLYAEIPKSNGLPRSLGKPRFLTVRPAHAGETANEDHTAVEEWNGKKLPIELAPKALTEINRALNPFGIRYAGMSWDSSAPQAAMVAGFSPDIAGTGEHETFGAEWAWVNPRYVRENTQIQVVFVEELWEGHIGVQDVGDCKQFDDPSSPISGSGLLLFDNRRGKIGRWGELAVAYTALVPPP